MLNGILLLLSLIFLSCGQFVIADAESKTSSKAKFPNKSFDEQLQYPTH